MEHQLWLEILFVLRQVLKSPRRTREHFGCEDIVLVWFWAVVHDRPVSWATKKCNWPLHQRRRRLPSNSTMSRRLRSSEVRRVIRAIEDRVLRSSELPPVVWMANHSQSGTVPKIDRPDMAERVTGMPKATNCT